MWINLANVTLAKIQESGGLWVAERCPEEGATYLTVWSAVAEDGDTLPKIIEKMVVPHFIKLPRSTEARFRKFSEILSANPCNILVIKDAHLLSRHALPHARRMAETFAPVVLCGDVLTIGAALLTHPSSIQHAQFCVDAVDVF